VAEHGWTMLCYKYLIDPGSKVVTLVDVIERIIINPSAFEDSDLTVEEALAKAKSEGKKGVVFPVQLQLLSYWVRSSWDTAEEANIRFSFVTPSGEKLLTQPTTIKLVESSAGRLVMPLDRLQIDSLGVYWFVVERECGEDQLEIVARLPLEIVVGTDHV
jgi:hypothetical protein